MPVRGSNVIRGRVTLRNLVRDLIDGEKRLTESKRDGKLVRDGECGKMERHPRRRKLVHEYPTHPAAARQQRAAGEQLLGRGPTCDVVLLEGVAVDLVLVGTVLLQPLAHILLGPQGHRFGQLHISWLGWEQKTPEMVSVLRETDDPPLIWENRVRTHLNGGQLSSSCTRRSPGPSAPAYGLTTGPYPGPRVPVPAAGAL